MEKNPNPDNKKEETNKVAEAGRHSVDIPEFRDLIIKREKEAPIIVAGSADEIEKAVLKLNTNEEGFALPTNEAAHPSTLKLTVRNAPGWGPYAYHQIGSGMGILQFAHKKIIAPHSAFLEWSERD